MTADTTADTTTDVYVLEVGVYNDRYIEGVYRTPEAAKAAWPRGTWTELSHGGWENDQDWGDAGSITALPLQG